MNSEKEKECIHKNISEYEECFHCGVVSGVCEDCDIEMIKEIGGDWQEE